MGDTLVARRRGIIDAAVTTLTASIDCRRNKETQPVADTPPAERNGAGLGRGERVVALIERYLADYGSDDDQTDFATFSRNPARYQQLLRQVLGDLIVRDQSLLEKLYEILGDDEPSQRQTAENVSSTNGAAHGYLAVMNVSSGSNSVTYTFGEHPPEVH